LDLGLFKVNANAFLNNKPLDAVSLQRLTQVKGVLAAYPKLEVKLPLGAHGGSQFFGRSLYTDLLMTAVPEALLREDAPNYRERDDVVQVYISPQLIDIYNSSIALTLNTPQITAETLRGFEFSMVVGKSLMLGSAGAKRVGEERALLGGTSRYAMRLGVTVSTQTAHRLLEKYALANADHYAAILVRVRNAADVPRVVASIKAAGFAVDETAEHTSDLINTATFILGFFGLLVLVFAALNIANSFYATLTERKVELNILRSVGASRFDLIRLVLMQAAVLGLIGGAVGVFTARLLAWGLQAMLRLEHLPFAVHEVFTYPLWMLVLGVLLGMVFAVLGALWPALKITRGSITVALNG
jgi:hypothetical protein